MSWKSAGILIWQHEVTCAGEEAGLAERCIRT
jgi:hypothetical protein